MAHPVWQRDRSTRQRLWFTPGARQWGQPRYPPEKIRKPEILWFGEWRAGLEKSPDISPRGEALGSRLRYSLCRGQSPERAGVKPLKEAIMADSSAARMTTGRVVNVALPLFLLALLIALCVQL